MDIVPAHLALTSFGGSVCKVIRDPFLSHSCPPNITSPLPPTLLLLFSLPLSGHPRALENPSDCFRRHLEVICQPAGVTLRMLLAKSTDAHDTVWREFLSRGPWLVVELCTKGHLLDLPLRLLLMSCTGLLGRLGDVGDPSACCPTSHRPSPPSFSACLLLSLFSLLGSSPPRLLLLHWATAMCRGGLNRGPPKQPHPQHYFHSSSQAEQLMAEMIAETV